MTIISWNVNGIRAVEKKGEIQTLVENYSPDILFLQEIKAQREQLSKYLTENADYEQHYHSAEKKGYSGVGLWVKKKTLDAIKRETKVETSMPDFDDTEGRILCLHLGQYTLFGVYFPNGGKSQEAWEGKLVFYDRFHQHINALRAAGRKVIWCGDLNVAHNEIDLARPKENKNSIGFLPQERAWVDRLCQDGWVDVFRSTYPETVSYTWWDAFTKARLRDVGWRIDYFLLDKDLFGQVEEISHLNLQMGSDHCPVMLKMKAF